MLVCMYAFANGRLYCEHRKILTLVINLFSMLTEKKNGTSYVLVVFKSSLGYMMLLKEKEKEALP